jgi:hypothetical protein
MTTVNNLNLTEPTPQATPAASKRTISRLALLASRVPASLWRYLLIGSDAVLILLAFVGAYALRYQAQLFISVDPAFQLPLAGYLPLALPLMVVHLIAFRFSQVYPYRPGRSWVEEIWRVATASTASVMIIIVVSLAFRPMLYSRLVFLYTAVLVTMLLGVSRLAIQWGRSHLRQYDIGVQRVLLVGAGDVGRMVMRTMVARPDYGLKLIGFLDDHPVKSTTDVGRFKALGPVENAADVIVQQQIDRVIICLPWQTHRTIQRLLRECEQVNVSSYVVPDLFQLTKNQMKFEELNGIPLLSTRDISIQGWNLVIKRTFDLVVGGLLGIFSLPVTLAIALAIRLDTPGPIFYKQARVGRNGRLFRCLQVPLDGGQRRRTARPVRRAQRVHRPALQDSQRPAHDARRAPDPPLQPRRTAAAHQRAARGNEPHRAPAEPAQRGGAVSGVDEEAAGRQPRHHRPLAGERAQRSHLRRDGAAGYLLCRKLEPGA